MSGRATIMVQWNDQHVQSMRRDAVENHLLLNGWVPLTYGRGGAGKVMSDGRSVHVVYLVHSNAVTGRGIRVQDHWTSMAELQRKGRASDSPYPWGMVGSDGDFAMLANRCIKEDNDGHNPF